MDNKVGPTIIIYTVLAKDGPGSVVVLLLLLIQATFFSEMAGLILFKFGPLKDSLLL